MVRERETVRVGTAVYKPFANGSQLLSGICHCLYLPLGRSVFARNLLGKGIDSRIANAVLAGKRLAIAQSLDALMLGRAVSRHPHNPVRAVLKGTCH